jgi:hypothetical protein
MPVAISVYLDTSDFSNFGDVIRGKSDEVTATAYRHLIQFAESGEVQFGYSMVTLSELFKYDSSHPEITLSKAEAMENICGENAFIYIDRLIAAQVRKAAYECGILKTPSEFQAIQDDYFWFPDVSGALDNAKKDLRSELQNRIMAAPINRSERRKAKAKSRKMDLTEGLEETISQFAELYKLPVEHIDRSIGAVFRGEITPDEGARRLFSAVAKPQNFVHAYFVQLEGEKDLPEFVAGLGRNLQERLVKIRSDFSQLPPPSPEEKRWFGEQLATVGRETAMHLFGLAEQGAEEFGLSYEVLQAFRNDEALASLVPSWGVFSKIIKPFIMQNLGWHGGGSHPERSAAGDLLHSIYLPHTDLWRGDKRFCHALKQAVPEHRSRIVSKLSDLPAAIELALSRT